MPHGEAPLAHIERAAVLCRPVLSFNTDTDTHAQPGFKACANGTLSFTFLSFSLSPGSLASLSISEQKGSSQLKLYP
jgi:hypothetical protein